MKVFYNCSFLPDFDKYCHLNKTDLFPILNNRIQYWNSLKRTQWEPYIKGRMELTFVNGLTIVGMPFYTNNCLSQLGIYNGQWSSNINSTTILTRSSISSETNLSRANHAVKPLTLKIQNANLTWSNQKLKEKNKLNCYGNTFKIIFNSYSTPPSIFTYSNTKHI